MKNYILKKINYFHIMEIIQKRKKFLIKLNKEFEEIIKECDTSQYVLYKILRNYRMYNLYKETLLLFKNLSKEVFKEVTKFSKERMYFADVDNYFKFKKKLNEIVFKTSLYENI